jgi:hypothetical protein
MELKKLNTTLSLKRLIGRSCSKNDFNLLFSLRLSKRTILTTSNASHKTLKLKIWRSIRWFLGTKIPNKLSVVMILILQIQIWSESWTKSSSNIILILPWAFVRKNEDPWYLIISDIYNHQNIWIIDWKIWWVWRITKRKIKNWRDIIKSSLNEP